jgi:large subunit ribosomal protein L29
MKSSELRSKTQDELSGLLVSLKKEAMNLRFQKVTGELAKTSRVREVRRDIAKILTIISAGEQPAAQKKSAKKSAKTKKSAKKNVKKTGESNA